jgi:hypothetical protein
MTFSGTAGTVNTPAPSSFVRVDTIPGQDILAWAESNTNVPMHTSRRIYMPSEGATNYWGMRTTYDIIKSNYGDYRIVIVAYNPLNTMPIAINLNSSGNWSGWKELAFADAPAKVEAASYLQPTTQEYPKYRISAVDRGAYFELAASDNSGNVFGRFLVSVGRVNGLEVHSERNNEPDKIVRTNSEGHLNVRYINSNTPVENERAANVIIDNGDGYYRKRSLEGFKSDLGITAASGNGIETTLSGMEWIYISAVSGVRWYKGAAAGFVKLVAWLGNVMFGAGSMGIYFTCPGGVTLNNYVAGSGFACCLYNGIYCKIIIESTVVDDGSRISFSFRTETPMPDYVDGFDVAIVMYMSGW